MVILLSILLSHLFAEGNFHTRCEKHKIYVGESVLCDYPFSSEDEYLDIEVAKFPEFRGFWSENLTLRQGPMILPLINLQTGERSVSIGSYRITPMLTRKDHLIEPMKVMVRSLRGRSANAITVESLPPELTLLPLPPFPTKEVAELFTGGVGTFQLQSESDAISFTPGEPTLLRVIVTGTGNFPDLLLPLNKIPKDVTLISEKNNYYKSNTESTKIFEFNLFLDGPGEHSINLPLWVTFNPDLSKYEQHLLKTIRFIPELHNADHWLNQDKPAEIEATFTIYRPIEKTTLFWVWQIPLFLLVLSTLLHRGYQTRRKSYEAGPTYLRKMGLKAVNEALERQDWEAFLLLSIKITQTYDNPNSPLTIALLNARNALLYSPEKSIGQNFDLLKRSYLEWSAGYTIPASENNIYI